MKIFSHSQAVSSSTWLSSFWPRVDTRAYPIFAITRARRRRARGAYGRPRRSRPRWHPAAVTSRVAAMALTVAQTVMRA